jgi:cytochrome b561
MKNKNTRKSNRTKTNLLIDIITFIAFLIAFAPYSTGIPIHEWLGIAVGGVVVVHLLLHWDWIVKTTQKFFNSMPRLKRINYILDALLFIDTVVIIFTGLMISEAALPALGIALPFLPLYITLHGLSANLAILIIGLHVALHWKWIVKAVQRFIIAPFSNKKTGLPKALKPHRR